MNAWPKRHECGAEISRDEWDRMPDGKVWRIGDVVLEMKECRCGSHISVEIEDEGRERSERR